MLSGVAASHLSSCASTTFSISALVGISSDYIVSEILSILMSSNKDTAKEPMLIMSVVILGDSDDELNDGRISAFLR